jgi:hypothetical protein
MVSHPPETPLGPKNGSANSRDGAENPGSFASGTTPSSEAQRVAGEQLAEQLRTAAGSIAANVKQGFSGAVDQKRSTVADGLSTLSESLLQASQKLSAEGDAMLSPCLKASAGKINDVAAYLRVTGLPQMGQDVSSFTKRHPEIALTSAVMAGFLLARVIKSMQADGSATAAKSNSDNDSWREYAP